MNLTLTVNGEERTLPERTTLLDVLEGRSRGIAVAVNREVVPRSDWASAALRDGDAVEILEVRPGG